MTAIKDAYTTQELAQLTGVSRQAVAQRASRESWQSRPRAGRGGGSEWLVSSMPEVTHTALVVAEASRTELATVASAPLALIPDVPGTAPDTVVPEWSRDLALARYRIVAEWRANVAKRQAKGVSSKEASAAFVTAYNAGILFSDLLEQVAEISVPTLYRWDGLLRRHHGDMMALADRRGKWTRGGPVGLGQIGREAEVLFLKAYLRDGKPSMSVAYYAMCAALEKQGLPLPSYSGVRRFFERFDAAYHDVVVFAREGAKMLSDTVGPYLSRDDKILHVGDVLISDGHRMNFMMINPETGKPARFTLIGWQDWASRMFVSFEIMLEENTQAIAASFHRAVLRLGKKPGSVLIDNGKAYKNEYFEGEADLTEFDGLYLRLGIHVAHSAPYVARTKGIERWWGDFDRQAAVAMESYIGASIDTKPAHLKRNETWHRERQGTWVPDLEAVKRLVTDYAKWKATQPHPTRPGTTPWEVFSAGRGPGFSQEESAALAREFMHRRVITPQRCRFSMFGVTFESDTLYGINKKLTAYYALADLSEVYVYDDGHLVGAARPVESVHPMAQLYGTELDVQTIKQAQKRHAKLRADTRDLAARLSEGGAEVLMGLPYMQGVAERRQTLVRVEPALPEASAQSLPAYELPVLDEAESAALRDVTAQHKARLAAAPTYTPPLFFGSELERYDFLFRVCFEERLPLKAEDTAFMVRYEASEEWATTGRRYEQLRRALYADMQPLEQTA